MLVVVQHLLLQEEQSPSYTCASIDSMIILTSLLARSLERTTRADMEAIKLVASIKHVDLAQGWGGETGVLEHWWRITSLWDADGFSESCGSNNTRLQKVMKRYCHALWT